MSDISGKGPIRLDAELSAVEMMAALAASKMAAIRLWVLGMVAEGMSAWLAAQAVLPVPGAAKQVRSSENHVFLAVANQMVAWIVKMAKVARLLMAGAKALSPEWEEVRWKSRYSHCSPAEVQLRFYVSSVFLEGEECFQVTARV